MIANRNRQIVLAARPVGAPKETDLRLVDGPVPVPAEGELLVRTIWLSLDPYQRLRMGTDLRYYPPLALGEVIVGGAVSRVVESRHPDFAPGDIVDDYTGWQDYAIAQGASARKVDPALGPLSTAIGVLGMPGLTAYLGLVKVGRPARRRHGGHLGGVGRGRRGRRPGGEDRGLPRRRHRRRGGEAALPHAGARLRPRPSTGMRTTCPAPRQGVPRRHRRLLRERRRAHRRCDLSAARPRRPRGDLRRHIALQRDRAAQGREPPRPHPLHRDRGEGLQHLLLRRALRACAQAPRPLAWRRPAQPTRRTWWRAWRMRPLAFQRLFDGRNFGKLLVKVSAE